MRKLRATAIALCALLTLAPTNPMFAIETAPRKAAPSVSTAPKNPLASPACGPEMQARVWQQTPAGDKRYRKLEGQDADDLLEKLRAGNPQWRNMHRDAVAALAKKGFKPAFGVEGETIVVQVEKRQQNAAVVTTPSALARLMNFFLPTVHAQDDVVYVPEGVLWASSWDDGDPATWEGVMGAHEYGYGNYGEGGAQIRNDTNDLAAGVPWSSGNVTMPGDYGSGANAYHHAIKKFFGCSAVGCFGGLGRCLFAGPFSVNCALINCGVSVASCTFGIYIEMAISNGRCGRFICHNDN